MLEYIGLVVLVGGVVAVIVASSGLDAVPKKYRAAICGVFNPGKKGCGISAQSQPVTQNPNVAYRPEKCEVSKTSGKYGSKITIGPIDIGMEFEAVTKRNSKGQVIVTIVDGATGGASGEFDLSKAGSNIESQGGGGLEGKLQYGDTYVFDDEAEYDKWKDRLRAEMQMELAKYSPGPGYAMGAAMKQEQVGEMRPPNVTLSKTTISGSGNFNGTATGTPAGDSSVAPGLEGAGDVKMAREVTVMHNKAKHENTHVYQLSIEGKGSLVAGGAGEDGESAGAGAEAQGKRSGAMQVVRDSRTGELKSIQFVQTTELTGNQKLGGTLEVEGGRAGAGGTAEYTDGKTRTHVVTTELKFEEGDGRQRRVAEQWLASHGKNPTALNIGANGMVPTQKPGPDASKFQQLMYNQSKVTDASYKGSVKGGKLGWELQYYLTLGMEMGLQVNEKDVSQAQYLGAPSDGKRSFVDYKDCKAPGS